MGQMILPIVVEYLLREYGFNGTILILAGLALHAFLGATLYQPVKWHFKVVTGGSHCDEMQLDSLVFLIINNFRVPK